MRKERNKRNDDGRKAESGKREDERVGNLVLCLVSLVSKTWVIPGSVPVFR